MKIKSALRILGEIKYVKSVLKRYSDVLACGKYHQHNIFRALSLDSPEVSEKSRLYFEKGSSSKIMQSIIKFLNGIGYFTNKNKKSTGEYDGFYIANNYDAVREVKLFSFKNDKILTICVGREEAEKQIKEYELFGKAYNMPSVKKDSRYETSFEISMVKLKNYDTDALAIENICYSTVAYNQKTENLPKRTVSELISFSYDEEMNGYLQKIADRINPSLMDTEIPLCTQHGDLSKDNLIYGDCDGKTDFWWIDWEHVEKRAFFYDLFFYMINPALYGDKAPFETYINGEVDEVLQKFFAHFGTEFEKDKRFDYFLIFTLPFLKERVCPIGGLPILKRYYALIEELANSVKTV